jgi:predicted metal-binding membrane protein
MSYDTFRSRFGLQRLPVVALVTYMIALLAWVSVVQRWLPMPGGGGMGMEMSAPGAPEAMALSNGASGILLYLLMWGVMMVAMMYPSSVPLFRIYGRTIEGTTKAGKAGRLAAFMGTYALVWTFTGVFPLVANAVVPIAAIANERSSLLFGGTLLLLSAYQLSAYKHRCLKYCRTPLGFLMEYHRPGVRGAAEMSARFSVFCVGCCWALFALMVVVGSMNILWMAGITVALSLERVVGWGDRLGRAIGVAAGVGGFVTLLLAVGGVTL